MCTRLIHVLLVLVGATVLPAFGQERQTTDAGHSSSDVTEQTVAGVKLLVKRRPGSQTVAVGLFFTGGSGNTTPDQAGIEALTLATAIEASHRFPRAALRRQTARLGAHLGYVVTYDYAAITLATTRRTFDQSWLLFADVVRRPRFADEDVALARDRLTASLLEAADDPETILQQTQAKVVYRRHPYAAHPTGTPETLARLTVADVRTHYAQMLVTQRLLLIVVGDLEPESVAKQARLLLTGLPTGAPPPPIPSLFWTNSDVTLTTRALPTDYVQGVYAAPPLTAPDFPALRLAVAVLRDRVFEEVRVKRHLSYAPTAFLTAQGANVGGIAVSAVDADQAVAVMLNEIERLRTELVEPAELRATAAQFLTTYYLAAETNSSQVMTLALYELVGGGWRQAFVAPDRLQAVTPEQVRAAARKYMVNLRFAIVGNETRVRALVSRFATTTPQD